MCDQDRYQYEITRELEIQETEIFDMEYISWLEANESDNLAYQMAHEDNHES